MKKDIFVLFLVAIIILFVVRGTKIQSVEDYYLTHLDDITEDSETVFLSIDCITVLDNLDRLDPNLRDEKYVPADGVILPMTEYVLRKNDTPFSILDRVARYNKIPLIRVYSNTGAGVYVQGLNGLFEFSCGALSGWMYGVNGVFSSMGSTAHNLKDGDVIEWKYTCDLGRDLSSGGVVQ